MADVEVKIDNPQEIDKIDIEKEIEKKVDEIVDEKEKELEEKKIELTLETFKSELFSMFNSFATNIENRISNVQNTCESILTMEVIEEEEKKEDEPPQEEFTEIEITPEEIEKSNEENKKIEKKKANVSLFGILIGGLVIMLLAFKFKSDEMNESMEEDNTDNVSRWY